jgi:DNA-binding NtrC family response regulator
VGSTRTIPVDVRVLAATHVDVKSRALEGDFRADLHARLAQLRIELPPLCERPEDILALLEPHLQGTPPMTPELVDALLNASWPQNVRELIAIATELRVWGQDRDRLDVDLVRARLAAPEPSEDAPARGTVSTEELDREALAELLRRHGGNVAAVAKALGRSRTQVYRLVSKHGLQLDAFRSDA